MLRKTIPCVTRLLVILVGLLLSPAGVLAQSQRSVRGLRVQKLRCDEVELFDPAVWEAAQLTTRSAHIPNFERRDGSRSSQSTSFGTGIVDSWRSHAAL